MKKAFLFPGTGETADSIWYPWLKERLTENNYRVKVLSFPHNDKPVLAECLNYALKKVSPKSDSLLIGHGSGCPVVLSFLEKAGVKVDKVVLTAGFCEVTEADKNSRKMVQREYDWPKIAASANEFIMINSRNNKLGYDDRYGSYMAEKLNGRLLIDDDDEIECCHDSGANDYPLILELLQEKTTK